MTREQKLQKVLISLLELLDDADVSFNSSWDTRRAEDCYDDIRREARSLAYPHMDVQDWVEIDATAARSA